MMITEKQQQFSKIMANLADSLDITESKFLEAKSRYETIGEWLDDHESELHNYKPKIYPQGSFQLGTMVKPINDVDEYDIDLVCHLEIDKSNVTQIELKRMVGDRLNENVTYRKMCKECNRCWTLNYANEFHMDILPAIPDYEKGNDNILITDKKLFSWQKSNPVGYADWFREKMLKILNERKICFSHNVQASIEEIPDYKVKTPLQRAVQILKRHRDIYFSGHDKKPISIIITTLSANVYQNEADLLETINNIVHNISERNLILDRSGKYYIPNPVNNNENFAEKWNDDPELPEAFFEWVKRLKRDINQAYESKGLHEVSETLSFSFGKEPVSAAFKDMGDNYRQERESGNLKMKSSTGSLGLIGESTVRKHRFYGSQI